MCVPYAGGARAGVSELDEPSEENLQLGVPAGGDRELTSSTRHRLVAAPPAGEESDCGTGGRRGGGGGGRDINTVSFSRSLDKLAECLTVQTFSCSSSGLLCADRRT